jgi:hypothetical protein
MTSGNDAFGDQLNRIDKELAEGTIMIQTFQATQTLFLNRQA